MRIHLNFIIIAASQKLESLKYVTPQKWYHCNLISIARDKRIFKGILC